MKNRLNQINQNKCLLIRKISKRKLKIIAKKGLINWFNDKWIDFLNFKIKKLKC